MPKKGEKRKYKRTLTCQDCGHETERAAPNQVRCPVCALARGAEWHDGRSSRCQGCGKDYIAWTGPKSMRFCGTCFLERAPLGGRASIKGRCGFADQGGCNSGTDHAVLFHERLAICYPCLHDPKKRRFTLLSIQRKYAKLKSGLDTKNSVR